MGALLGLGVGVGLVLVLVGLTSTPAPPRPRRRRLAALVERAGARVTPGGVLGLCATAGVTASLVALLVTALPAVALVAGVVAAYAPVALLRRRAAQRQAALRTAWPDAVDALVSAVRSGMSLAESLADLGRRGPEPLRPAFAHVAAEYRATGSFGAALDELRDTLADPVADRVVAALRIAREVGGTDLGRVLRTLSELLREDARTRGEIEARQSWTVNAARLAVAAPWITLALLSTRPETVTAYATATGAVVLVVAAGLSVLAYRLMLLIGRVPAEQRVLA